MNLMARVGYKVSRQKFLILSFVAMENIGITTALVDARNSIPSASYTNPNLEQITNNSERITRNANQEPLTVNY